MLFDRARLRDVGGFDPGYMHAWADDNHLQLRGLLYGYECLHVPAAAAAHHAKDHGAERARRSTIAFGCSRRSIANARCSSCFRVC